jgi:uncharacterized protein (TIGR00251 family)
MTSGDVDAVIAAVADGSTVRVHLQPRASRTEICGVHGDELKVRVTSPPVDDAANRLCIEFFAKLNKVAKSRVTIISGSRSRHKTIHISGIKSDQLLAILANEIKPPLKSSP